MNRFFVLIVLAVLVATTGASVAVDPFAAGARVRSDGWFAERERDRAAPAIPEKITKTFVIPIHEAITPKLYDSVKRKVVQCKALGAELVIFDMNTPGGQLDSTGKIVHLITDELKDIYTIAYVNPEAISAGAIISLACSQIVMHPSGNIGDAMPIMIVGGKLVPMPKEERGKFESYLRSQVRSLAQRNGHNIALCEAMITMTRQVWMIRNISTKQLMLIDPDSGKWGGQIANAPTRDKKKAATTKPADYKWEFVKIIDRADELVTLTAKEAMESAFVDHIFDDMSALKKHYNIAEEPIVLTDTWAEVLVGWLTSPIVAGLLMLLGIMGIYIELKTPGIGLPGAVGVICLALLFGGHFLMGMAAWWEIAVFILGLILLALEIFVIPGFGVAGISGILCCLVGLLAMFVDNPPDKLPIPSGELSWAIFNSGLIAIACAIVMSAICSVLLAKYLPNIPIANRLVLTPSGGPVESAAPGASDDAPIQKIQPGQVGILQSPCRPAGTARFADDLVDVEAENEFIAAGTKVKVLKIDGNVIVVTQQT